VAGRLGHGAVEHVGDRREQRAAGSRPAALRSRWRPAAPTAITTPNSVRWSAVMPLLRRLAPTGRSFLLHAGTEALVEHRQLQRRARGDVRGARGTCELLQTLPAGPSQRARCPKPHRRPRSHTALGWPVTANGLHRGFCEALLSAREDPQTVALVGHGGFWKGPRWAEALLHKAGAITRMGRVEDGTTVTDFDP